MKKTIDGRNFWNPYEGLGIAADLLKLAHQWIQSGRFESSNDSAATATRNLKVLENCIRALRPKIKFAVQEWNYVRIGDKSEPNPVWLTTADLDMLRAVQLQIISMEDGISASAGGVRLEDLAIEYPTAEIQFTSENYFRFVRRSINEVLSMETTGKLSGPSLNEFI